MKKNRNSFFQESNMNYMIGGDNQMMPQMMPQNIPYQGTNYNQPYGAINAYPDASNIEQRLAKMERQINRLTHRVEKLESSNQSILIEDGIDTTNNMYML